MTLGDMCASVKPCLRHGVGHDMRANVRPCLGHGIGVDMCASVRPCLGHGVGHIMRASSAKLALGIEGRRRHRSHYHLKLLVGASKGGKKAW
ncbi:UvrABC system C [Gossypium arboreum]|uniref:UvrABC system C n=1 Tax=Gossypium arboreum TaxID=29729 RepID=A0A0B0MUR6_GOSAR|nr:UvrABC system C [Gossypium arboreum]